MNLIKYDTFFSPLITVDSTSITIDSRELTIDRTSELISNFHIEIIPRKYANSVELKIRDLINGEVITFDTESVNHNGLFYIDFKDFIPIIDTKYEVVVNNHLGDVIWLGQAMYSEKDIQNYSSSNSDENNLRF